MTSITNSNAWKALAEHHKSMNSLQMRDLFLEDKDRFKNNHIQFEDFLIDYSKNRITNKTIPLLINLAH